MLDKGIFQFDKVTIAPNMRAELIAEQYAAHNRFLTERLGSADKKSLGRMEYLFEWGSICSYMDIKTGECVIRVEY